MRKIVGLIGLCLIGGSVGIYFDSIQTGICLLFIILGIGLFVDSLKK